MLETLNMPDSHDGSTRSVYRNSYVIWEAWVFFKVLHFSPASVCPINSAHSQTPNPRTNIHHVVINFNYPNIAELEIKINIAFFKFNRFLPKYTFTDLHSSERLPGLWHSICGGDLYHSSFVKSRSCSKFEWKSFNRFKHKLRYRMDKGDIHATCP